jgi:hypothetical protein
VATPIPFFTDKRQEFIVSPYLPDRYYTFLDKGDIRRDAASRATYKIDYSSN